MADRIEPTEPVEEARQKAERKVAAVVKIGRDRPPLFYDPDIGPIVWAPNAECARGLFGAMADTPTEDLGNEDQYGRRLFSVAT